MPDQSDTQSQEFLKNLSLEEQIRTAKVPGVRTTLVVLSSRGMGFDIESLRQKILLSYPDSTVFFLTPIGKPVGSLAPARVDLMIDLIGPSQRQKWFLAKKLRGMSRVAVGRNAGLFRKRIYDRVFDEKEGPEAAGLPEDLLEKERFVQRRVLNLAGVPVVQYGDTLPDRGKTIARELPPMQKI